MREQLIEEIERLRREVDKLRREKTELKKAEEELCASEEQYRNLFDTAPEAITLVGFDGTILNVNNAAEIITGLPIEEIIGKRFTELGVVHEKDLPKYTEALSQLASGESIQPYEVELTFKGKKHRWFEVFSALLKKDDKPYAVQVITRDITERKRAEEESVRLSNAVRMSTDSIVISDLDAKIIGVNEATLKMYGTDDKRDLIGKNPFALIASEEREKALAGMKEVLEKGYITSREYHIITKDGGRVPVEMSVAIMKEADGKPIGFVAVIRDITERKKAEEELEAGRKKLESYIESMVDGVVICDLTGNTVDINKACLELLGYKRREDVVGRSGFIRSISNKDMPKIFAILEEIIKKGYVKDREITVLAQDRREIPILFSATSIEEPEGKPTSIFTIFKDITELKRVEQTLRESEEKYRDLVENINDAIYTTDRDGTVTYISPVIEWLTGYSPSEIMGRSVAELLDEEDLPRAIGDFERVLSGHSTEGEYRFHTKSGEIHWMGTSNRPIFAGDDVVGAHGVLSDTTRRKQAEEELRRSGEKYRTILENIVEGYYEADLAGNFTFVNDSLCNNLGYSRDEMIGMNNRDYMDEQTARKVLERFAEVYTTGIPARGFEFEVIRKDGTKLVTSSSVSLIVDSQGQPTGFRGVVRNVTAEKQAEERLRQSEEKYRTILENIVEGYYETDLAGNFTFVNDSMCKIGGYTRDEMIGMNNRQYMDKEVAKRVYQLFNKIYTTGKPSKGADWEIIRKDGTKRFIDSSVSLIRDAQGKPIGFRGVARDITERKKAEQAQRQNEAKYRTILESIEHGYFEVDLAGNFTFFNDAMCQIVGYTRDETMGTNNRQYMDEKTAKKVYQTFNRVYTTGKPDRGFDWEVTRKDGTKRIVEASVFLVRDSKDKPTGFRGIIRDITERRKAEAERKALEQQAQVAARLSTMGEMASGIVHEINNPLTSVVGFAEMLASKDLPEDARDYARIISDEGKRVTGIANRLLSFARHQKPETVYTDINKLIEDTIELQTYEMRTGNIKVTTELDPHLLKTMADPGQLQQVFLNIMLNARKELRAAHGGGNLLVKTQALDGAIQISLKDDGPGIPKKNLERIFNPFFTTKKVREGTGLGLSICQGIINSHNGKIYARSTPGKGATFIIELPVVTRRRKTTQARSAIDKPRRPARVRRQR